MENEMSYRKCLATFVNLFIFLSLFFCTYWNFKEINILTVTRSLNTSSEDIIYDYAQRLTIQNATVESIKFKQRLKLDDLNVQMNKICEMENWEVILKPCQRQLNWSNRSSNKMRPTNLLKSTVVLLIRSQGYPSTIKIDTFDSSGKRKEYGGDSWRVKVTSDNFSMSVRIRDHLDGSYKGYFTPYNAGRYTLHCVLDHTACNGVRDPPPNWFRIGK